MENFTTIEKNNSHKEKNIKKQTIEKEVNRDQNFSSFEERKSLRNDKNKKNNLDANNFQTIENGNVKKIIEYKKSENTLESSKKEKNKKQIKFN